MSGRPSFKLEIDAIGFSSPSCHSMARLFYGFVMYLVLRSRKSELFKGLAISRIYLGAHFPSDVLAGFIASAIWLILSILVLDWIQWQSKSSIRPVRGIRDFLAKMLKGALKKFNVIK